jgi:small subunit ribosomal protein S6
MTEYEIMVIVDRDAEDSLEGVVDRVTKILTEGGGEVTGVERWGKRKFAYEINHKNEGFYLLFGFKAEAEPVAELERVLLLADEIVRFKVVRKAA